MKKYQSGKHFPRFPPFRTNFSGSTASAPNRYPATVTAEKRAIPKSVKKHQFEPQKHKQKQRLAIKKSQACTNWLPHMDCPRPLPYKGSFHGAHTLRVPAFLRPPFACNRTAFSWFKSKGHNIKYKKTPSTGVFLCLAAPHGFEPRLTQSECAVLPLDDGAIVRNWNSSIAFPYKCQQQFLQSKKLFFPPLFFRRSFNRRLFAFLCINVG